jgi:RTX calcium-binding nonapeptide repeat (4 copies)
VPTCRAVSGGETDTLISIENVTGTKFQDYIRGYAGNNQILGLGYCNWLVGSGGADFFDGATGRGMVSYVYAGAGATVNLGTAYGGAGQAAGDRYVSIERVIGSVYNDLIYGSSGPDDFRGLYGEDRSNPPIFHGARL